MKRLLKYGGPAERQVFETENCCAGVRLNFYQKGHVEVRIEDQILMAEDAEELSVLFAEIADVLKSRT